jgi:CRISPR-associated protein Csh1
MITELSNYVDSLGEKLDWLLFENRSLEAGEYYLYDTDNTEPRKFSLKFHFEVNKKGEFTDGIEQSEVYTYLRDNDYFKKLFLSRTITSNKRLCEQIATNNPFVVQFDTKNYEKLSRSIDKFYKTNGKLYSDRINESGFTEESAYAQSIFREILEQSGRYITTDKKFVTVFFNLPLDFLNLLSEIYFKLKIYNVNDFTIENGNLGLHSFKINTNVKKPLQFSQSSFTHSFRLAEFKTAINLNVFENLLRLKENKIPNPLPIFIYSEQMNNKIIETVKATGKLSLRDIIIELKEKHSTNFNNYYLLNWGKGMTISIRDFDYVERFNYELTDFRVHKLIQNKKEEESIKTIFEFEVKVANAIFNNLLITNKEKPVFHYFDDLSTNTGFNKIPNKTLIKNLVGFRYSFYEYIYKSKTTAISGSLFYNLIISNVTDLILSSKEVPKGSITKILNILFSLNHKFDINNHNFGGREMPSELPKYFDNISALVNEPGTNLNDDYEYAFCAGQLVYYLLSKSKSSTKTHSLVEPFINRTTVASFNDQLIRTFNQYKHAINFKNRKFNKLFEQVIGYTPSTSFKEMLPVFFAGYFCENIIYGNQLTQTQEEYSDDE